MTITDLRAPLTWRKSRQCESDQCVEVAETGAGMAVRDSTLPAAALHFDASSWASFISDVPARHR